MRFFGDILLDIPNDLLLVVTKQFLTLKDISSALIALMPENKDNHLQKYHSLVEVFQQQFLPYINLIPREKIPFLVKTYLEKIPRLTPPIPFPPLSLTVVENNNLELLDFLYHSKRFNSQHIDSNIFALEYLIEKLIIVEPDFDKLIYMLFRQGELPFSYSLLISRHLIRLIVEEEELSWHEVINASQYSLEQKFTLIKWAVTIVSDLPSLDVLFNTVFKELSFNDSKRLFKELLLNFAIESANYIVKKYLIESLLDEDQKHQYIQAALENTMPNPALILFLKLHPHFLVHYPSYEPYTVLLEPYISWDEVTNDENPIDNEENTTLLEWDSETEFGNRVLSEFQLPVQAHTETTDATLNLFHHLAYWSQPYSVLDDSFIKRYHGEFASITDLGNQVYEALALFINTQCTIQKKAGRIYNTEGKALEQLLEGFRYFFAHSKITYPIKIEAFLILDKLAKHFRFNIRFRAEISSLYARILDSDAESWHVLSLGMHFIDPSLGLNKGRYQQKLTHCLVELLNANLIHNGRIIPIANFNNTSIHCIDYFTLINLLYHLGYSNKQVLFIKLLQIIPLLKEDNIPDSYKSSIKKELYTLCDLSTDAALEAIDYPFGELRYFILSCMIQHPKFHLQDPKDLLLCFDFVFNNPHVEPSLKLYLAIELIRFEVVTKELICQPNSVIKILNRYLPLKTAKQYGSFINSIIHSLLEQFQALNQPQLVQLAQLTGITVDQRLYNQPFALKRQLLEAAASLSPDHAKLALGHLNQVEEEESAVVCLASQFTK